jgi:potassium channel subfamily K
MHIVGEKLTATVQIRDVRALRGDDANMMAIWRGEESKTKRDRKQAKEEHQYSDLESTALISRVQRYRNTFAEILVIGSILQKLEGSNQKEFERWRGEAEIAKQLIEEPDQIVHEEYRGLGMRMVKHHLTKVCRSGSAV